MRNALPAFKAAIVIIAVLTSSPAAAQSPGDMIFVTDRTGVQTDGRLLHISTDGLTLLVDGQERLIPSISVGRVEKRDSRWNGMLIGGAVSAGLFGAVAGATCSSECDGLVLPVTALYGAIGAGIGALIDSAVHGHSTVDGPSLASPNARRTPAPVASLDELWLRVREGDTIDVTTTRGQKVSGKFVQASRTSVTITVGGDLREIPSSDVRVVRRKGNRYRSGALWGGAIFGTASALASAACNGDSNECGNPLVIGAVVGSSGAFWGTVIGALIPKHPVVYGSGNFSSVRVSPILQVGRLGLALSASF